MQSSNSTGYNNYNMLHNNNSNNANSVINNPMSPDNCWIPSIAQCRNIPSSPQERNFRDTHHGARNAGYCSGGSVDEPQLYYDEYDGLVSAPMSPVDRDEEDDHCEDDDGSLESYDGTGGGPVTHDDGNTFQSIARHSPVSDCDLVSIPVRELNQRLQGYDRQMITALKQKRRTLKNRGYAYKCRVRRLQVQVQLESENSLLKSEISKLNQRLVESQHMKSELFALRKEVRRLRGELYGESPDNGNFDFYHTQLDNNNNDNCRNNSNNNNIHGNFHAGAENNRQRAWPAMGVEIPANQ